ncbi:hypothetical protein GE09DRAFT_1125181 [Coniochaeta sp. 2T2.1]|nr:hypothetical protein GE09DRAFT_1125181 [Coniochaeta sp. 2T2.1]
MATSASPETAMQADGNTFAASAAGTSARAAPPKVTPVPIPKPGSQPSVPGLPSKPAANPPAASQPPNDAVRQSATPAPSAAARPNIDALRPIIQDGRVRSPMPGKLKGKLDKKNGMFGVMLMTGPTTSDIGKRDAEAKRASESTQAAAEQALASGQGTMRRRKFVRLPPDPIPAPSSSAPPVQSSPALASPPPPFYGFTDAGIKQEQARLLTVLRSLNPVRVVDQICTALAFFGGIPGAPPPPDGVFPPSAMANGSGKLFVSWIAEIFPPVPHYGAPAPLVQGAPPPPEQVDLTQGNPPEPGQRKRGRPKGSKSSLPRKDKGIKKGPVWARPDPDPTPKPKRPRGRPRKNPPVEAANPVEESWVDVNQDEEENEDGVPGSEQAQAPAAASAANGGASSAARTALPSGINGSESEATPKRRGGPKGTQIRQPKSNLSDAASASQGNQPAQNSATGPAAPVPNFAPVLQTTSSQGPPPAAGNSASFTPVNSASVTQTGPEITGQPETPAKKKRGRTKKPSSKADEAASAAGAQSQTTADGTAALSGQPTAASYDPSQYTQQAAAQATQPLQGTEPRGGDTTAQPAATAQKRKRKAKNATQDSGPGANIDTQSIAQQALHTSGMTVASENGASAAHQDGPPENGPSLAPPPAKRSRKSKAAKANATTSTVKPDAQPSLVDTSTTSEAAPEAFEDTFEASDQVSAHNHLSLDVDHAISSLQSPHEDSNFDVTSPTTMENYQAQLQAEMSAHKKHDHDGEPSHVVELATPQNRVDPRQLMAQQQQQQYQQTPYQQRQQQQRQQPSQQTQQSTLQVSQGSTGHARSPSLQHQGSVSQQDSTRAPQTASARASQHRFNQYGGTAQFARPQSYSPQQAVTQTAQAQQYPTATQQQQYNNTAQQQYPSGQSQYSSGSQQQNAAQPRYQQQLSTGGPPFTASQSPQFTSANTANYHGSGSNVNFNSPSYNPLQRGMTASTASNGYRGAQNRSPSTFAASPASATTQQHQRSSSNTSSQSLQNTALQSFAAAAGSNTANAGWDLFDASSGAGAQNHGQNMAAYGSVARTTPSAASGFSHSSQGSIGGFDPSALGTGNERFYGVGRR